MTLGDLGESGLIQRIRSQNLLPLGEGGVRVNIGDDAAIFDVPSGHSVVFCSDLLAENTHFIRNLHPPEAVAYKAIAANVSDVGAMGGIPMHFLLSFAAPPALEVSWLDSFLEGLFRACQDFEISLLGGDTSSSEHIFIDVSMTGRIPTGRAVLRSGARAGDKIHVTGSLGASMLGLELLKSGRLDHAAVQRHLYPQPRNRVGHAVLDRAHAMIDVSDGLSTDLAHIVQESKVSARIYKHQIPAAHDAKDEHILHGGEEYELIIVAPALPTTIEGIPVTVIGEIIESAIDHQVFLIDGTRESPLQPHGWRHF